MSAGGAVSVERWLASSWGAMCRAKVCDRCGGILLTDQEMALGLSPKRHTYAMCRDSRRPNAAGRAVPGMGKP